MFVDLASGYVFCPVCDGVDPAWWFLRQVVNLTHTSLAFLRFDSHSGASSPRVGWSLVLPTATPDSGFMVLVMGMPWPSIQDYAQDDPVFGISWRTAHDRLKTTLRFGLLHPFVTNVICPHFVSIWTHFVSICTQKPKTNLLWFTQSELRPVPCDESTQWL